MFGKVNFKCKFVEQKALKKIDQVLAHNTFLVYPYYKKRFDIHTSARDFQLGVVINR